MAEERALSELVFYGYPRAREASSPYIHTPGSNPVVRGIPLAVAGSVCVIQFLDIASF